MNNLVSAPADFRYPISGTRDQRDLDEESGDESVLVDSENEDSDIDLDFIDGSEDEDECCHFSGKNISRFISIKV